MTAFIVLGWYLLVGILVHLFIPKPPRAKEAFRMAEEIRPGFSVLIMLGVAILWPIAIIGVVRRFIHRWF